MVAGPNYFFKVVSPTSHASMHPRGIRLYAVKRRWAQLAEIACAFLVALAHVYTYVIIKVGASLWSLRCIGGNKASLIDALCPKQ